jgi:hypothetical protein
MAADVSLTFGLQPTDILSVENCRLTGYAHNSDMFTADIMLADRSSSWPVRVSSKFLSSDVPTDFQVVSKAFRFCPNDHESNEQLTNVRSY